MVQGNEPRWYYVGNGQLRYKDLNGWTDQYQDIDGPPRTAEVEPAEVERQDASDLLGPVRGRGAEVEAQRRPSPFRKVCFSAAHRSRAGLAQAGAGLRTLVIRRGSALDDSSPNPMPTELSPEWMTVLGIDPDSRGEPTPTTFTTHGKVTLTRRAAGTGDWRRAGIAGPEGLTSGAKVRITDVSGETLAIGELEPNGYAPGEGDRSIGSSVFTFTVDEIPAGEDTYAVVVGGHSTRFTSAQMQNGPVMSIAESGRPTQIHS